MSYYGNAGLPRSARSRGRPVSVLRWNASVYAMTCQSAGGTRIRGFVSGYSRHSVRIGAATRPAEMTPRSRPWQGLQALHKTCRQDSTGVLSVISSFPPETE